MIRRSRKKAGAADEEPLLFDFVAEVEAKPPKPVAAKTSEPRSEKTDRPARLAKPETKPKSREKSDAETGANRETAQEPQGVIAAKPAVAQEPKAAQAPEARAESVTAFTRRVKTLLETGLAAGWVRGEVSNLRVQASGHMYFSLKDAGAQLSAVLFRGDAARQTVRLRDGQQVLVFGRVSVYEARGQYQLVVREVVEDGVGRLQQEFEALKRRLAAEGLFDAERKHELPTMPRTIGFITSPTGAAVQDFLRILARRGWRGRVVVLPARVQGAEAAGEMVEALRVAEFLGIFDLLVIGRGGGSLEDLWAFNEEPLVRAVAACPIPIISAVGHEIDFTLCDFAADLRAETPSGAAEHISSGFVAVEERVRQLGEALYRGTQRGIDVWQQRVLRVESRLKLLSPRAQIEQYALRLDDYANRLGAALRMGMQEARHRLAAIQGAWARVSPEMRLEQLAQQLDGMEKRLHSVSAHSVLQRGFAIVRDEAGRPVTQRAGLAAGQRVETEFADGRVPMRVEQ